MTFKMYERAFIFLSLLKLTDKWSLICYVLLTQHSTHTRRCLNQFHTNCVSVLYISNSIYLWIFVYMLSNKHQSLSVKRINFNLNYVYTVPFHSSKFRLPHGMEWGINRNRVFKENNHTHTQRLSKNRKTKNGFFIRWTVFDVCESTLQKNHSQHKK